MTKLFVTALLFVTAQLLSLDVRSVAVAAEPVPIAPMAAATPTPILPCPEWRVAGGQIIYKCVDDEPPYATCYAPAGGVMQCLKE